MICMRDEIFPTILKVDSLSTLKTENLDEEEINEQVTTGITNAYEEIYPMIGYMD